MTLISVKGNVVNLGESIWRLVMVIGDLYMNQMSEEQMELLTPPNTQTHRTRTKQPETTTQQTKPQNKTTTNKRKYII